MERLRYFTRLLRNPDIIRDGRGNSVREVRRYGTTQKYWIILFVAVICTCVTSILCIHNVTGNNDKKEYYSRWWGQAWLFDVLTFNTAFLNINYNSSGYIVVFSHITLSCALITYGIVTLHTNTISLKQINYYGMPFLTLLFVYRVFLYLVNYFDTSIAFDNRILYWLIPEIIFMLVWFTNTSDKSTMKMLTREDYNEKIRFWDYMGFVTICGTKFIVFLLAIIIATIKIANAYTLNWTNVYLHLWIITACYIMLTYFYYLIMVVACASRIKLATQSRRSLSYHNFLRSFYIVGKDNFGSACYHATIVIPRIHTLFVMKEPAYLQETRQCVIMCRNEGKINSLSPILTGAQGINHRESIRKILELIISNGSSVMNSFQTFTYMAKSFSAIIIGFNCLINTLLWVYGFTLESQFLMEMWLMYFKVTCINYIFMRFHDAAADAIIINAENYIALELNICK